MFRARIISEDAERSTLLLWSRAAAAGTGPYLTGPVMLGDVPCDDVPFPVAYPLSFCERAAKVSAPPGVYPVTCAGVPFGDATVLPGRTRPDLTWLPPGSPAALVEATLEQYDVELRPGTYTFNRAIRLPPNRRLTGYGAHVFRTPDGDYGERLFRGGEDCTVTGLTFHAPYLTFHGEETPGLIVADCTFRSGILGYGYVDIVVRDSLFHGGYAPYAPPGLYLRNTFLGGAPNSALQFMGEYAGNTALLHNTFRETRDAIVVNVNRGSFTDNLFHGNRAYGICGSFNGNEFRSCEGDAQNECSRNLDLFSCVSGCNSPMYISEAPRRDEFVYGLDADGPSSICLDGWGGCEVSGNVFASYELRGGRVLIGAKDAAGNIVSGKVVRNRFFGRHVGPPLASRMNQSSLRAELAGTSPVYAFSPEELAANTFETESLAA